MSFHINRDVQRRKMYKKGVVQCKAFYNSQNSARFSRKLQVFSRKTNVKYSYSVLFIK